MSATLPAIYAHTLVVVDGGSLTLWDCARREIAREQDDAAAFQG